MDKITAKKKKIWWKIIVTIALILIILTLTPIVIKSGKTDPRLFFMPYTLWVSIFITIALVILTYLGGRVHLNNHKK